jgi:hypothetical protein
MMQQSVPHCIAICTTLRRNLYAFSYRIDCKNVTTPLTMALKTIENSNKNEIKTKIKN